MTWRALTSIAALLAITALAAACGDSDDDDGTTSGSTAAAATASAATTAAEGTTAGTATAAEPAAGEWPAPNGDWGNTRVAQGSTITSENVAELGIAWQVPITATGIFGGYASTPIILGGTVFTQDLNSNVQAIDVASGEVRWEKTYDSPNVGPNGVAVSNGRVYGATSDSAFALDAGSGEEVWKSEKLVRNANEGIDMAPGVNGELVYVSTVPGNTNSFYKGNGQGVLWALNAETGEMAWKYETVPADLWSAEHTNINSGGGLWHPPAFDDQGGVYVSVANPAPFPGTAKLPWGQSRPGPNPDSNTLVKLDAASGEVTWKNQLLPHDIYDWDLHLPPILADTDDGQQLVLTGGKMGYVYAVDRESGELAWEIAVGEHTDNDDDNLLALDGRYDQIPKLPNRVLPGHFGGIETQMALDQGVIFAPVVNMATTFKSQTEPEADFANGKGELVALDVKTGDQLWSHAFDTPPYGAATVANDLVFTTTFDGTVHALDTASGDEVWSTKLPAGTNATVAIAGDTLITAATYPQGADQKASIIAFKLGATGGGEPPAPTSSEQPTTGAAAADGESVFAASCGSCHTLAAAGTTGSVGPNLDQSTADETAIAEQVANGGGGMPAFGGRLTDQELQAVVQFVAQSRDPNAEAPQGGGGP